MRWQSSWEYLHQVCSRWGKAFSTGAIFQVGRLKAVKMLCCNDSPGIGIIFRSSFYVKLLGLTIGIYSQQFCWEGSRAQIQGVITPDSSWLSQIWDPLTITKAWKSRMVLPSHRNAVPMKRLRHGLEALLLEDIAFLQVQQYIVLWCFLTVVQNCLQTCLFPEVHLAKPMSGYDTASSALLSCNMVVQVGWSGAEKPPWL